MDRGETSRVPQHHPPEILRRGLVHRIRDMRERPRHMMLEAALADVPEQRLQIVDLHHSRAAERLEWILRESTLADVAADLPRAIVRREAREAHVARAHL